MNQTLLHVSNKWLLRYVIKEKQKAAKEEVNKSELAEKEEGATEKKKSTKSKERKETQERRNGRSQVTRR